MNSGIWRHKLCLDIDIYIHKVQYKCNDYYKVKLSIFNRRNKDIVYETKGYKIYTKDFSMWEKVA